jgi:hypothetical protein
LNQITDVVELSKTSSLLNVQVFSTDKSSTVIDIPYFIKDNKLVDTFEFQNFTSNFFVINSENKIILNAHKYVQNFLIFTDIISENQVLNKSQPILKIIKPEGKLGDYCEKWYERPHYLLCNKTFLNRIFIQIKDNNLNLIHFNSPGVILKLHFKKIKSK